MTSGDEPQLSQPNPDDNAPMISGRGTKGIADAHRAYLDRNFPQVFNALTEAQRLAFRVGVVRVLREVIFAQPLPSTPVMAELIENLSLLDRWIAHPTDDNLSLLRLNSFDLVVRNSRYMALNGLVFAARGHHNSLMGLDVILRSTLPDTEAYKQALHSCINNWLVEALWATAHGSPTPEFPCDLASVSQLMEDAEHWYRHNNLEMLVRLFTPEQRRRLLEALYQQTQWYFGLVSQSAWSDDLRPIIAGMVGWLDEPPSPYEPPETADLAHSAVKSASQAFSTYAHLTDEKLHAAHLVRAAIADVLEFISDDEFADLLSIDYLHDAKFWQLDAAWAIYHDQPVPPVEDVR